MEQVSWLTAGVQLETPWTVELPAPKATITVAHPLSFDTLEEPRVDAALADWQPLALLQLDGMPTYRMRIPDTFQPFSYLADTVGMHLRHLAEVGLVFPFVLDKETQTYRYNVLLERATVEVSTLQPGTVQYTLRIGGMDLDVSPSGTTSALRMENMTWSYALTISLLQDKAGTVLSVPFPPATPQWDALRTAKQRFPTFDALERHYERYYGVHTLHLAVTREMLYRILVDSSLASVTQV